MLNEQGKRIDWHSENFNKESESIKKNQSEPKSKIAVMRNKLKELTSD